MKTNEAIGRTNALSPVFHQTSEERSGSRWERTFPKGDSMKRIVAIALFFAASFLTTRTAMAQDYVVEVNVPFSFNVNTNVLPAGHYSIAVDMEQPSILTFRDRTRGIVAVNLAINDPSGASKAGTVVFSHYGDQYFLKEIHFRSSSSGVVFPASKLEKRAKKLDQMEKKVVSAS
jgi:hypothetical protein